MVDLRKAARGRCAPSEFLATAITIRKRLCWRITDWRERAGTAIKPHDMQAAIACSSCHDLIDGRVKTSDYTKRKNYAWCMQKVFFTYRKKSGERKVIYDLPNKYRQSGNTFVSPRWKVSGFRENCACGGAGRILAAVRQGICLTSCWRQKIDENSHQWSPAQNEKSRNGKLSWKRFCERWSTASKRAGLQRIITDAEALKIDSVIGWSSGGSSRTTKCPESALCGARMSKRNGRVIKRTVPRVGVDYMPTSCWSVVACCWVHFVFTYERSVRLCLKNRAKWATNCFNFGTLRIAVSRGKLSAWTLIQPAIERVLLFLWRDIRNDI